MKKIAFSYILFIVILFLNSLNSLAQNGYIAWTKEVKLSWNDFQGTTVPDSLAHHHAITWVTSEWDNFKVYDDSIVTDFVCYFIINKSWKSKHISDALLNHEQRHFDLAEIVTRKMRKELFDYISTDNDSTTKYFKYLSTDKYLKERRKIMDEYDTETDHGRIKEAQKKWDAKIDKMLKELEGYSSPHVVIKRKQNNINKPR